MKKTRKALTLAVRQQLWMMRAGGEGIREIARRVKISPSVVSREFERNKLPLNVAARLSLLERAEASHKQAKRRLSEKRRGRRTGFPRLQVNEHIAQKLADGWSPEKIANTFGEYFFGQTLSTSTIYRIIRRDAPELVKYLPERGKKRRLRVVDRRGRFKLGAPEKRHKDERPEAAEKRLEIGHWEVDSILSKRGAKAAIISIIDRKARKRRYLWVPNLEAATVRKALVRFLWSLPAAARKTFTLDRGSEFAEWAMLETIFPGLKIYFCTPYSPHEKGSVERSNRDFRWFFPKKTDFGEVQEAVILQVELKINHKPMKCLGWRSPESVYQAELAQLKVAA